MWRSNRFATNSAWNSARRLRKHIVLKEAFCDNALGHTQTNGWFKRFKNGWMSVDDEERSGWPSTGTTTENVAKVREAILEDWWRTNHDVCNIVRLSYGTCQGIFSHELNMRCIAAKFVPRLTTLRLTRRSCSTFWLPRTRHSSPILPTHRTSPHVIFFYSPSWNCSSRADVLAGLKRSRPYRRTRCRRWLEMTSRSASDRRNPAGIAVSMPKGTTSKGRGANRNFCKC